jgi:hypothetical protein
MAAAKNDTGAVAVERHDWGVIFTGTMDALVAAGIAAIEHFTPPGKGRFVIHSHRGNRIHVLKSARRGIYTVRREGLTTEEQRLLEEERAAARAKKSIDGLPRSVGDYRAEVYRFADHFIGLTVYSHLREGRGGYRFTRESFDRIMLAIADFLDAVKTGDIEFSPAHRAQEETSIRAAELPHSPGFERFMASIVAPPKSSGG